MLQSQLLLHVCCIIAEQNSASLNTAVVFQKERYCFRMTEEYDSTVIIALQDVSTFVCKC